MTIVIHKKDSKATIQSKLKKAGEMARELNRKEIESLCGILKERFQGDPAEVIRKERDAEWN